MKAGIPVRKLKKLPLANVYGHLETGPVILMTTANMGKNNVMTMSWHTMLEFEPPLIGCVVSERNHSFNMLRASGECVIGIPTMEQASVVVKIGNTSGRNMDKFSTFGLATSVASVVKAPLIPECYLNLECRIRNTTLVNKYNFFVLEVLKAWIQPSKNLPRTIHHFGNGVFRVAGKTLRLKSGMK